MTQRTALILAAALTAFVLVIIGAVAAHMGLVGEASAAAAAVPAARVEGLPAAAQPGTEQPSAQPQQDTSLATISPDLAATIALNVLPGASVVRSPELVDFQGRVAYEVVLDQGTLYVDATTGRILNPPMRFSGFPYREREDHEEREEHGWFEWEHEDD